MAKFYDKIGFVETIDDGYGVWQEKVVREANYYGDVLLNARRWNDGGNVNENLDIKNKLSILADPYAYQHFHSMKYVHWMNQYWKITEIEVQYPRLILTIGGVYNGPTETAS